MWSHQVLQSTSTSTWRYYCRSSTVLWSTFSAGTKIRSQIYRYFKVPVLALLRHIPVRVATAVPQTLVILILYQSTNWQVPVPVVSYYPYFKVVLAGIQPKCYTHTSGEATGAKDKGLLNLVVLIVVKFSTGRSRASKCQVPRYR